MLRRMGFVLSIFLLIVLCFNMPLFLGHPVYGEDYPTRPIKSIVPFPPGGVMDLISRSMADTEAKILGQPVVIENKPGGGTSLAYTIIANAKPDGYTIGQLSAGAFVNTSLAYDVSYHPLKSFTYIGGVGLYAMSIIVKSTSPWKTWEEFINYSYKHPNEIRMGLTNPIGGNAAATKWINREKGLKWKEVQLRGDAGCITALLGGHIDAFAGGGAHNILVKDGRARMLLALTTDPIPGYPNVPTFKQVYGKEVNNLAGFLGPAGIPTPILKKLEKATYEGTKDPKFLSVMEKMSMTPMWRNSQEFTQDVKTQYYVFQKFLKDLNLLKKK